MGAFAEVGYEWHALPCTAQQRQTVGGRARRVADCRRETMKGRAMIHEAGPSAELPRYEGYLPPSLPALLPAPILHLLRAQFAFFKRLRLIVLCKCGRTGPGSNAIPTGTPYSPELRARCRSGRMKKAQDCLNCTVQPCRNSHQNSI
jgi:hypothetical protein